jgi:hypothetical protein
MWSASQSPLRIGAGSLNPATPVGSPVAVNPDTVVAASPADARAQEPASAANAQALARFAKVSGAPGQQLDRQLLEMAGLVRSIPEIGQCERSATGDHRAAVGSHGAGGDFELLDAGTVRLFPGDEAAVTLAPRAFPGVSSFNSGVVYTSRDRSTSLPSGLDYRVEVSGGSRVAPMTIRGIAPRQLEHVTLNGSPLQHVEAVSNLGPQDLTWDVGAAGDTVYLDLTANDVAESVRCAYADESGAGTVPAALLASLHGAGHLTVHRLRRLHTVPEPVSHAVVAGILPQRAELRFDFEVSRVVRFAEVAAGRTTAIVAPLEAVRANEAARPADAVPGMEIQRTAELMRPAGSLRRVAAVAETPVSEAE